MSENPYRAPEKLAADREPFVLQWRHIIGAFFILVGVVVLLLATMLISSFAVETVRDIRPISYENLFITGWWLLIGLAWGISGTSITEARYRLGTYTAFAAVIQTVVWIAIVT